MWKYFDLDNNAAFTKPMESIMPVDKPFLVENELFQVQNACVVRN